MLGRIIMKIDTTFKQCFTSSILLCILKNNFQKPTHLIFCFFCFQILVEVNYFKFRWIISNKFELIHLNKNMKTKENWFKSFNDKNKPTEAVGIQTVAPPPFLRKITPWLGLGFWSRLGLVLGLGATRQLLWRKFALWLGSGFGLGLVFGVGGNFPCRQLSWNWSSHQSYSVKRLQHMCFQVKLIFKNTYFEEHLLPAASESTCNVCKRLQSDYSFV